ncbi:MAG: hypothetical protein M3R25_01175 [Bacteroidota bacterium]|nr:hypothetical protein [Bacteroidota bacterium]
MKSIISLCLLLCSGWLTAQQINLTVEGYDMHIELNWNALPTADRYEVFRKAPGDASYSLFRSTRQLRLQDWTGRNQPQSDTFSYFIHALSVPGNILTTSDTLGDIVTAMSDEEYLDMVQEYTFRYFWEYGHPVSGMARERLGSDEIVTTGGSGFGVMSILVGIHRGWITRAQGTDRLLQIVSFLQFAEKFHGAFPHWMNGTTGKVFPFSTFDNGGDLVETAFLMEGLLSARQFFDQDTPKENALRDVITTLWEDVEWDHYARNNSGVLYWHWSPEYQWQLNFQIRGYNEALIVYLLAIASPTHPVPASYYHSGWAGGNYESGLTWYGHKLFVGPPLGGPLFFAHYSFMGFDPRDKKDAYANYFVQNTNHTLINRAWCIANPLLFEGYNAQSWGLTASDDPFGYSAHAPGGTTDNGTLTPAAALPSMPYTPDESIEVMRHFYQEYGASLWGPYGYYDAFNPEENWYADSYLAIDQGPIINMIENYRSGLLWSSFMANPEIQPALDAIGFEEDLVAIEHPASQKSQWSVFPTLNEGSFTITLTDKLNEKITILCTDILGRSISFQALESGSAYNISLRNEHDKGWVWVLLANASGPLGAIPVYIQ